MTELVPYQDRIINSYDDLESTAKAMVASGYFSDSAKTSQAIVKIMAGREVGVGPFTSMNGIHIIQGKPAFGANIMAAKVKASGKYNYRVIEHNDKVCSIDFYELFNGKWEKAGNSIFTAEDAKKAGTKNMDKYARNMLFARAMSNGVKWYCPDVMNGNTVYTPEELGAEVDGDGNVIDIQPVAVREVGPEPAEDQPEIQDDIAEAFDLEEEPITQDDEPLTIEAAYKIQSDTNGKMYGELTISELAARYNELSRSLKDNNLSERERNAKEIKRKAAKLLLDAKKNKEIN